MLVAAVLVLTAGCSPSPSPSEEPAPVGPASACWNLELPQCASVMADLPAHLPPGVRIQYVEVAASFCDGPCPGIGPGGFRAHVVAEALDDREPIAYIVEADAAGTRWEVIPTAFHRAVAGSGAHAGGEVRMSLGHCGLASGIDADGSFWDPVGRLDWTNGELINATDGRFGLTGPRTARFVTALGLVIDLVRHAGPKYVPPCR